MRGERAFRGRVNVEMVTWSQPGAGVPTEAALPPQEAIARGLVLRPHGGHPLVPDRHAAAARLPQARPQPLSRGTERELQNAVEGFRDKGKPSMWLYRREEEPMVGLSDWHRDDKLAQWEKLQAFLAAWANPDVSLAGRINGYSAPEDFRRLFEQHLRDRLTQLIKQAGLAAQEPAPIES